MKYWYDLLMNALSEAEYINTAFQASKRVRDTNNFFYISAFPVVESMTWK